MIGSDGVEFVVGVDMLVLVNGDVDGGAGR